LDDGDEKEDEFRVFVVEPQKLTKVFFVDEHFLLLLPLSSSLSEKDDDDDDDNVDDDDETENCRIILKNDLSHCVATRREYIFRKRGCVEGGGRD